jgi:hypothetical protein
MPKNVYIVETSETCLVHKQYAVEAYTMEQAKDMILNGDLGESGREQDHYITSDLDVNEILSIKHCGIVEEENA